MDKMYKGDLFKKLQEIKEWQIKQQEKLFTQQKEQQEVLVRQRKKAMEILRLKKNDSKGDTSFREYPFNPVFEENHEQPGIVTSSVEEINERETNSENDTENFDANVSLDDVPVKPSHRDFKELLEEKLKEDDPGIILDGVKKSSGISKSKRKFLRKGEGLKRFRMQPEDAQKKITSKSKKPLSTVNSSSRSTKPKEPPASGASYSEKSKEKQEHERCVEQSASPNSESSTWADVFTQESKFLREKKPQVKERKIHAEDKNNKHEGVDLEVFELLEQMAVDSSFCSTSSTLLGFMESPIISTPLKAIMEKREHSARPSKKLPFGLDNSGESDASKDDFDSSSDNSSTESQETAFGAVAKMVPQGVARVRFSSLVEEREFDPGMDDSSVQDNSPNLSKDQFRDTEAWSDHESDSSIEGEQPTVVKMSENISRAEKPTDMKLEASTPVALSDKCGASSSASGDKFFKSDTQSGQDKLCGNDIQSRQDPTSIVFKSELLRQKMLELEHEIEKFRKENEKLSRKKKAQEQAHAQWLKEKSEMEKKLWEKEEILKNTVLEERKKFNREKQVFERYCKELRNQPTKQEREEVTALQQKLSALQQELRQKESRSAAAQARITTRLKTLEKENTQLKEEVEKLKKEKLLEAKRTQGRISHKTVSNTKSLHAINNRLSQLRNPDGEQCVVIQDVIPTKHVPASGLQEETKAGMKFHSKTNKSGKPLSQRSKTVGIGRNSGMPSVGCGTSLRRVNSVPNLVRKELPKGDSLMLNNHHVSEQNVEDGGISNKGLNVDKECVEEDSGDRFNRDKSDEQLTNFERTVLGQLGDGPDLSRTLPTSFTRTSTKSFRERERASELIDKSLLEVVCDSLYPRDSTTAQTVRFQKRSPNNQSSSKLYPVEKINADGSREIRYENGNFKRISPDGVSSKLVYYNGDVKECLSDGTVKYYYSETRTWHTTFTDGLEVLEFPNGQVERHSHGSTEVSFPDGTIRLIHPNGKEEVMLPDGTMATIEPNGDQLIQLPNGQKEYQTKEYKKRVYPDGTVKLLYSDGVQETRYASGRVRLRDSDGNLVMDQNPDD